MPEDSWKERLRRAAEGFNDRLAEKGSQWGEAIKRYAPGAARMAQEADSGIEATKERINSNRYVQAAGGVHDRVVEGSVGQAINKLSGVKEYNERWAMAEKQRMLDEQIAQLQQIQQQHQMREQAKLEALAKGHVDLGEVEEWPEYAQQYPPIELDQAPQGPGRQPVGFHRGW